MRVVNTLILDGYAQSSGNVSTNPVWIGHFVGYSASITVASGSSYGGTAKLQASNDMGRDSSGTDVSNWVDLPNTGATANISLTSDGTYLWNVDGAFYKWIRINVARTAGSATLSIRFNGKGPDAQ